MSPFMSCLFGGFLAMSMFVLLPVWRMFPL